MQKILEVGALLSSERDLNRLLERILTCVMELAHCDAGTLYLLDGGQLRFKILRNDTLRRYSGGDGSDPGLPPVPLRRENVCALALLEDRTICIEDVYHCGEYNFTGPIRYDAQSGYHTQSMLVVPMRSRGGEKVGVLQLINAQDAAGRVCAFSPEMAPVLESVASQAAITIQNVRYLHQIQGLLWSFVRVMSTAIDAQAAYNADHSRRIAGYAQRFMDYLNERAAGSGQPQPFSPQRQQELVMSAWLHDVGKVITPLEVMDKAERLRADQKAEIAHRFECIRLQAKIDRLEGRIGTAEQEALEAETRAAEEEIARLSTAGFITDQQLEWLAGLRAKSCRIGGGAPCSWLNEGEYEMLSIRRGTLSAQERKIMEEHAVITDRLLAQISFTPEFAHVRQWAAAHHELLNGSGYPRHLKAGEIPTEVRILTILDIFDALVAKDRPYKPGMPAGRALAILDEMAVKEGKLDPTLTALFAESRCWQQPGDEAAEGKAAGRAEG